jgi:hypothetical protein
MSIPEPLLAAYRAARYVVHADQAPVMRIGERCPEMDALLESDQARSAAFLTPYNPRGEPASDEENRKAFAELGEILKHYPCKQYLGEGSDPEEAWTPEASVLLVDIRRADAEALGRRFHQLAIVWIDKGGPAELVPLV